MTDKSCDVVQHPLAYKKPCLESSRKTLAFTEFLCDSLEKQKGTASNSRNRGYVRTYKVSASLHQRNEL